MTLRSRLLTANCVIFATLFAATAVSLWVVWVLASSLNWVSGEYRELRLIDHANNDLAAVEGLLRSDRLDFDLIEQKLQSALNGLAYYVQLQDVDEYAPTDLAVEHEASKLESAENIMRSLEAICETLAVYKLKGAAEDTDRAAGFADSEVSDSVRRALADIKSLARRANTVVTEAHNRGRVALRRSVLLLLGVNMLAVSVVILSGTLQYRAVVPPLARMRDRVREIASGRFDQRISYPGRDEFGDLAGDFNRMVEELEALYQDLEQRVQTKSRQLARSERLASMGYLAAGVAHEINNPLGIIAGYAELALKDLRKRRDGLADQESVQGLEIIRDEAFRCKKIIEKLLSLVRNPEGPRVEVSLSDLVYEIASMINGLKQFNGRSPALNVSPKDTMKVLAHEAEIKQVLLNLTVNAMEAADDQGGWVEISGATRGGEVELSVIDNGRGMTADTLAHVFEPFYTDKRGGGERGNGLGLSIVHAIIEDHGGRIEAYSDGPGRGSRFTIHLPVSGVSEPSDAPHGAQAD